MGSTSRGMACCSATVPATPTVSPPKGFKLPCSFCSSTNGFAAHSPTAASTTAPTPSTSRPASSKPPTTAPTRPFNRSSICSPPELTVTIVELFLSTILQGRIYKCSNDDLHGVITLFRLLREASSGTAIYPEHVLKEIPLRDIPFDIENL